MTRWTLTIAAFHQATVELASRADARKVLDNASYDYGRRGASVRFGESSLSRRGHRSWLLYGPAGYVGRLECRGKR